MKIQELFEKYNLNGSIIKSIRYDQTADDLGNLKFCFQFPFNNYESASDEYIEPLSFKIDFHDVTEYNPISFYFDNLIVLNWEYKNGLVVLKTINKETKDYVEFSFKSPEVDIEDITNIADFLTPNNLILHLYLEGFDLYLQIKNYSPVIENSEFESWCEVSLNVKNEGLLNYSLVNQEILTNEEIDNINSLLCFYITEEGTSNMMVETKENDLSFYYVPKIPENANLSPLASGFFLNLRFWDRGKITSNSLKLSLSEFNAYALKVYLDIISGSYSLERDKKAIHELIVGDYLTRADKPNPLYPSKKNKSKE